jgi:hypothetical protein
MHGRLARPVQNFLPGCACWLCSLDSSHFHKLLLLLLREAPQVQMKTDDAL